VLLAVYVCIIPSNNNPVKLQGFGNLV
jgi:hypothetical protein